MTESKPIFHTRDKHKGRFKRTLHAVEVVATCMYCTATRVEHRYPSPQYRERTWHFVCDDCQQYHDRLKSSLFELRRGYRKLTNRLTSTRQAIRKRGETPERLARLTALEAEMANYKKQINELAAKLKALEDAIYKTE